jgi:hypothetical protein
LLLLWKGQLIQVGSHLGLGREKNHILVLTCARQVSTILQVATQRKAPVYTVASASRQGCVLSISGTPHAEYSFIDVKHLHIIRLCLLEQAAALSR